MAEHNDTGNKAEAMAAKFLLNKGYEVLYQNYTLGKGEIDIVVLKEGWLVFVEVRARSEITHGFPEQTISKNKAGLIIKTAENYIYEHDWHGNVRFDIIAITLGEKFEIMHFEDAFF
jgi:putative endonuclease